MCDLSKLIKSIGRKYTKLKNGTNDWQKEKDKVQELLKLISFKIKERYSLSDTINIGGAGVVIKVYDMNLGAIHALKFPRPVKDKEPLMADIMEREISRLVEAKHDNIVSVYYKNEVTLNGQIWPFYIMEYIEGAIDAAEYLNSNNRDYKDLLSILDQATKGLKFLHSQNIIHCDVKFENILVSPHGKVKISDLGSAKLLDPEASGYTTLTFTKTWAHPDMVKEVSSTYVSESNRMGGEIKRSNLKVAFDLYALGKNLLYIINRGHYMNTIPPYYRNYLELMSCRLLDGHNLDGERSFLNLTSKIFTEIKYNSFEEVCLDIAKITGQYTLHDAMPELNHHPPKTIQISSSGATAFTDRVGKLLSLPYFRRLATVSQLGFIIQIYPSASHSRLEHILGTYANVIKYCDALWNDPINPLFKQIITEKDIRLILVTAICHDIGQYPLAHDFEGAERSTFDHGQIGESFLTDTSSSNGKSLQKCLLNDWQIDPNDIVKLLKINYSDYNTPLKLRLLHSIIDGPIDADKLDYLIRDSNHLNVPYGRAIDFERLLKCLTVVLEKKHADNMFISIGIHEKGKITAEAIAFARYAMFGSVYWHHTSRSTKSMLHRAVWEALELSAKRREGNLRNELFRELIQYGSNSVSNLSQKELFPESTELSETPQLSQTDYQILVWLSKRTSVWGQNLLKMICDRQVYKRLAVLSYRRDSKLWEDLIEFRSDKGWKENLMLQRQIQTNLIDSIQQKTEEYNKKINATIKKNEVIFILDIVNNRIGSSVGLSFRPEVRAQGPIRSIEEDFVMEDSLVWRSLATDFVKSVGKTRLFCHPDMIDVCLSLDRREIEAAIGAAIETVIEGI